MTPVIYIYLFAGAVLGVLAAMLALWILRRARRRALADSLGTGLYLVKVPRSAKREGEQPDVKSEVGKFEQLLSSLISLKKPVVFEVAVPHVGEEIHFYMAAAKNVSDSVIKQIQSLWNGASVNEVSDDYNIFNPQGATSAANLVAKENFALPIRTYAELNADSFSAILGGLAKVNEVGEGGALQVVLRPAGKDLRKTVQGYIDRLKKGESAEKIFKAGFAANLSEALVNKSEKEKEEERQNRVVDEDAVKALEAKISKPLFNANIRLLASASTPRQADEILDGMLSGFEQFSSPRRNGFRVARARNPQKLASQFIFRSYEAGQNVVLNSEELAGLYHFPLSTTLTPRVKWLKAKEAEPPSNLPQKGTLIGTSNFRGEEKKVYLTEEDRRRHVYTVGQTGTGKSTLLAGMILDDIRQGKGVAVIDPHGELVASVLSHIPANRAEDVICFDPGDLQKPLGLNMLEFNPDRPEEKTFIVNEMQSIFNRLFSQETMGPMFEQYMRNALLLLMEDMVNEPATLTEVPRVFTDTEWRRKKLGRIANPVVVDFWEKEAAKAGGEASLANMTPYITSKFNNFIANDYVRPIIGQPRSAFNFRKAMDEGKILLINLAKGRIGDINASLLGMILTGKLSMAALSRTDVPNAEDRRDFYLYIDEFHNFTTDSISTILSEARKYRLNLTMAHQFIAQLTEKIRDSVFGNVGSEIVFRVGVQDADFLVKQFEPVFDQNDLISIDNLNAYAKILINGETSKPFNIRIPTDVWAPGDKDLAEKIRSRSRERYGAERSQVEADILSRLRS